jgi:N-acetyl-D-muramate 6-phosphate phosphatase
MNPIHAVLFDLDGTLLDTVPDLMFAINRLREEQGLLALSLAEIRPVVSLGSKIMVKLALGMEENDPDFAATREHFLAIYQRHLADSTQLFPDVEKVLTHLEQHHIPWGIVTNKLTRHTSSLLKALRLDHRPACIICGDSLSKQKPDPEPILYACQLLKQDPKNCLYVGDSATDMMASKAAGTQSLVALYGYIGVDEDPLTWQADGYIQAPIQLLEWVKPGK